MLTRIILCALFAGNVISLNAQRQDQEVKVESQSLATAGIRSVEAESEGGNISIEGVPDGEARVEVYAWGRGSEERIRQNYSDYYNVKISVEKGELTVSSKRKRSIARDVQISVSFRLYVPVSASSDIQTSGGNISCSNLSAGSQRVKTSGGNIAFNKVKGDVVGKTSGGNVSIRNCGESLDVSTSGGNIHAVQSNGKLTLFTSGGNISLEELSGTIKATTSGGNVGANRVDGSLVTSSSGGNLHLGDLSCSLDASTSGGNLNVALTKMGDHVKLRNSGSGHTQLELPGSIGVDLHATGRSVKLERSSGFSGDLSEREVKGSLNGGGVPVTIDGGDSRVVVSTR